MVTKFVGFDSPNFTQAPNQFFDQLLKEIEDQSELKVTLVAIRQTFGYHRTKAEMSRAFLEQATGLSKNSVKRGIKLALRRGTLLVARRSDNRRGCLYAIAMTDEIRAKVGGGQPLTPRGSAIDPLEGQPLTPIKKDKDRRRTNTPSISTSSDGLPPNDSTRRRPNRRNAQKTDKRAAAAAAVDESVPRPSRDTSTLQREMVSALASVTGLDVRLNGKGLATGAADLVRAGYTPEQLLKCFGPGESWWYRCEWRGQKGQRPTVKAINENIRAALESKVNESTTSSIRNSDGSFNL